MYQTGQVNTHCFQGGGALRLLDVGTGKVTTLIEVPEGIVRDPEVHFDGKKILFSMRHDIRDDYHLYEMNAQGGNLRQLTFAPGVSDIQPIYLPDDTIVFSSTRDPKYIPCQLHLMANLFRMNADGPNIRQIGYNEQFEGRASLMPVAAGHYVPDAFTGTRDGRGITWGLCHITGIGTPEIRHSILARFDCDVSQDAHDPSMKQRDLSLKPEAYFSHGLSKQQRE